MKTIPNISRVTDNSGELPVLTYSNPVTTVINDPAPPVIITRIFYDLSCNCDCDCCCNCGCCDCDFDWDCDCNCCDF